jgi:putative ABC transport system permease protein
VAALSLALGIAANTVIFSLINTTLLRPLPFADSRRLMAMWTAPLDRTDQHDSVSIAMYLDWKEHARSFESMGSLFGSGSETGAEENGRPAEHLSGQYFSPSMFQTLGVTVAMGRTFTEEEGKPGQLAPVVIISDKLWQRRFKADPNVIGKTIGLDGVTNTIIGVMPRDFDFFGEDTDFWGASGFTRERTPSAAGLVLVIAKLKPGVSMQQAQAEMSAVTAHFVASDPNRFKGIGASVQPLQEAAFGGFRNPLLLLQGSVAFVLLIGCANVAGLLLARAASRRTEVAIRSAVGAGRGRLIRQLLTESTLLALLGGLLGVALAWGGLKLFIASAPPGFPRLKELSLDAQVLGFTALVAILTGFFFGLVPALQNSRPDLVDALKDSSRSTSSGAARQRLRSGLVTVQIALALVLLIGAGLMINSFVRIQNSDLGLDPHGLLTFDFRYPVLQIMKRLGFYKGVGLWEVSPNVQLTFEQVLARVKGLPGVVSAAGASRAPLQGAFGMDFLIDGRPTPPTTATGGSTQNAGYISVTPNYFATLKIPILKGRDFDEHDNNAGPPVIIVNQTMAKRYWPDQDPIGKHITLDFVPNEPSREIIAVVGDTRLSRMQRQPGPLFYVSYSQQVQWRGPNLGERAGMLFILKTTGDPVALTPAVKQAVAEVDRSRPLTDFRSVEQIMNQQGQYVYTRLYVLLLTVFGAIAAILAAIGIYGVMSYNVAQRTHEIGIRMALGASTRAVLGMVVRQALWLIAIGLALGLAGSLALTRLIESALWGVTARDPLTFAGVSVFLALVALIACFIPTRQAAGVDPTVALRSE